MKMAAKIFTILGMIINFISDLIIRSYGIVSNFWMISGMILLLIVGITSLKKLNTAQNKKDITSVAICNLIFCSFLGGIFMLCIPDSEFTEVRVEKKITDVTSGYSPETEDLTKLNKLH